MAGRLSNADANNVLDTRFGGFASTAPTTYYVGLSTSQPTDNGNNVSEPDAASGYARVAVPNDATNWPDANNRTKGNGLEIVFPEPTDRWGTIFYFVLYDAPTGGQMRAWGSLNSAQTIEMGAVPSFAPYSLYISAPGF